MTSLPPKRENPCIDEANPIWRNILNTEAFAGIRGLEDENDKLKSIIRRERSLTRKLHDQFFNDAAEVRDLRAEVAAQQEEIFLLRELAASVRPALMKELDGREIKRENKELRREIVKQKAQIEGNMKDGVPMFLIALVATALLILSHWDVTPLNRAMLREASAMLTGVAFTLLYTKVSREHEH